MPLTSLDGEFETSLAGATNITTNGVASAPNDLAVVLACGNSNSGGVIGGSPGAGWTSELALAYQQIVPASGPFSVTSPLNSLYDTLQVLCLFKTIGVPVWSERGSGSGGSVLSNNGAFTPTAGNSLLWLCNAGGSPGGPTSFQNAQGLSWSLLSNVMRHSVDGGFNHDANLIVWYTENLPAQLIPNGGLQLNVFSGGTWGLWEISKLLVGGLRLLTSLG